MRIASWNVNSIRVREQHVIDWMERMQPDVLGLQEIKITDDRFPAEAFIEAGYEISVFGQKTYNGVALLARKTPADVVCAMPGYDDEQRRVIAATCDGIRVINVYVPNGQSVGSDKYVYKLGWLDAMKSYLEAELANHEKLVVMGDFNIAPEDRDVHDPDAWLGQVLCSEPERQRLNALIELGLADSFRLFEQPDGVYSWWDYRAAAFRRNRGLRIDLLLVSKGLAGNCAASAVDLEPRRLDRPSDHAPVYIDID